MRRYTITTGPQSKIVSRHGELNAACLEFLKIYTNSTPSTSYPVNLYDRARHQVIYQIVVRKLKAKAH